MIDTFRGLLDVLQRAYGGDRRRLADVVVAANQQLHARGVHESLLATMNGVVAATSDPPLGFGIEEVAAAYAMLRISEG